MAEIRDTYILEAKAVGVAELANAYLRIQLAQDGLATSQNKLVTATNLQTWLDRTQAKLNPFGAALGRLTTEFEKSRKAFNQGLFGTGDAGFAAYEAHLKSVNALFEKQIVTAQNAEQALRGVERAQAAATSVRARVETTTGVSAQPTGFRSAADFPGLSAQVEKEYQAAAAAAQRLKDEINPLAAAQARYNAQVAEARALHEQQLLTDEELAQVQTKLARSLDLVAQKTQAALAAEQARAAVPSVKSRIDALTGVSAQPTGYQSAADFPGLIAQAERDYAAAAAAAQRLKDAVNPLAAAQASYNRQVAEARSLREQELLTEREYGQVLVSLGNDLDLVTQKAKSTEAAQRALAAASSVKGKIEAATGVSAQPTGFRSAADFPGLTSISDRQYQAAAAAAQRLKAAIDPLAAAQAAYNAKVAEAEALQESDLLTTEELAQAKGLYATELQKTSRLIESGGKIAVTAGLNWQNMGYQINDVLSGIAMGQSPFMILTQQGGQIIQVLQGSEGGIVGGLKQMGAALVRLVGPTTLAFGGLAAAAGVAGKAVYDAIGQNEAFRTSLEGIGQGSGATVEQLRSIADASSVAGRISVSEASSLAVALTRTGRIGVQQYAGIIQASHDYAIATGQDAAAAQKDLAEAFSDPAKGVDLLAGKLGGLSAKQHEYITSLAASGQATEAQNALLAFMRQRTDDAASSQSRLTKEVDEFFTTIARGKDRIGNAVIDAVDPGLESRYRRALNNRGQISDVGGDAQKQADDLNEQIRRNSARTSSVAQDRAGEKLAFDASGVANGIAPAQKALLDLKNNAELLQRALDQIHLDPRNFSPDQVIAVELAFARATEKLKDYASAQDALAAEQQKAVAIAEAQVQGVQAVTIADQAAAASALSLAQAKGTLASEQEKQFNAEQAYQAVVAQSIAAQQAQAQQAQLSAAAQNELSKAIASGAVHLQDAGIYAQAYQQQAMNLAAALQIEGQAAIEAAKGNTAFAAQLLQNAAALRAAASAAVSVTAAQTAAAASAQRSATSYQNSAHEAADLRIQIAGIGQDAKSTAIALAQSDAAFEGLDQKATAAKAAVAALNVEMERSKIAADAAEHIKEMQYEINHLGDSAEDVAAHVARMGAEFKGYDETTADILAKEARWQEYFNQIKSGADGAGNSISNLGEKARQALANEGTFLSGGNTARQAGSFSAVSGSQIEDATKQFGEGGFTWEQNNPGTHGAPVYEAVPNAQGKQFQADQSYAKAHGGQDKQQVYSNSGLEQLQTAITDAMKATTNDNSTSTALNTTTSTSVANDNQYTVNSPQGRPNPYADNVASLFYNAQNQDTPYTEHQLQAATTTANNTQKTADNTSTIASYNQQQIAVLQNLYNLAAADAAKGVSADQVASELAKWLQQAGFTDLVSTAKTEATKAPTLTDYYTNTSTATNTSTTSTNVQKAAWLGGFADAGSFTVPGTGGTDKLFSIGLTPGERVSVTKPGRDEDGKVVNFDMGGITINVQGDGDRGALLDSAHMIEMRMRNALNKAMAG